MMPGKAKRASPPKRKGPSRAVEAKGSGEDAWEGSTRPAELIEGCFGRYVDHTPYLSEKPDDKIPIVDTIGHGLLGSIFTAYLHVTGHMPDYRA